MVPPLFFAVTQMMISQSFVSLLEDFCQFPFQFISIDIAGNDGAVWGKEDGMREGVNSVKCSWNVLGIDDLWIRDAEVTDGFLCLFGLVAEGDAKYR